MAILHTDARLVMCNLFLDIARQVHRTYLPGTKFGTRCETLYVSVCVAIGHMDGKPFTASKLAEFLDIPRTTVLRHLAALTQQGLVVRSGDHYCINESIANSREALEAHHKIRGMAQRAAERLSKMDTKVLVGGM
jgi:DNA-binding transcriptional ArsR family regulator